jgi:cerevisin
MATPHLCGLTAYYLSLQPSEDSEYGMAAITPAKIKRYIISVATKGVLSGIPSGTPNLPAWNGGGVSNISHIVKSGSYKVETKAQKTTLNELKEAIENELNILSGTLKKKERSLS